jgi:hypothetical protein
MLEDQIETHHFQPTTVMKKTLLQSDLARSSQIQQSSHTVTAGYAGALGASDVYGSKPTFHKGSEGN